MDAWSAYDRAHRDHVERRYPRILDLLGDRGWCDEYGVAIRAYRGCVRDRRAIGRAFRWRRQIKAIRAIRGVLGI